MSRTKRTEKPYGSQITTPSPAWLSPLEADTPRAAESRVKLSEIHLPQQQPRRYFDPEAMRALVESIKQHGILQPLLVRPLESGGYELVAGERRYRAATEVGLTEVPVTVRELSKLDAFQLALIENLQREDLNPIEETEGILQLLAIQLGRDVESVPTLMYRLQKSRPQAATTVDENVMVKGELDEPEVSNNVMGKSESDSIEPASFDRVTSSIASSAPDHQGALDPDIKTISAVFTGLGLMTWESFVNNRLPLLNLPLDVLEVLRRGEIEYTKAKAIAQIKDDTERSAFLKEALSQNLSLSQIKSRIKARQPQPSQSQSSQLATELPERLKGAYQRIKKTRIWSDPKKRKQLETLLLKLEALVGED